MNAIAATHSQAWIVWFVLFIVLASTPGTGATGPHPANPVASDAAADQIRLGKRIYREGILVSGDPISATVQGDVPLSGEQVVCESCHRRSGLGSSEGGDVIPPITGSKLYAPRIIKRRELYQSREKGTGTRSAYTDETLAQAIRNGVDPSGRPLYELMPRYALSDPDMRALVAYLKSRSAAPDPGINQTELHIATVVTEGVDPEKRKAMLDVLEAYIRDKNAGTRHEARRAENPPWHKDWVYRSYRKWVLHVWELQGASESWRAQLDVLYRRQPVFAMISGMASGSWQAIHDFCEHRELPCLFPNTDLPGSSRGGFYSVYFSQGMALEAETIARWIHEREKFDPNPAIVQVYRNTDHGTVAAAAFRRALEGYDISGPDDRVIASTDPVSIDFWRELLHGAEQAVMVLWLRTSDLKSLEALADADPVPRRIYISSSLVGHDWPSWPGRFGERIWLAHPFALPDPAPRGVARSKAWLKAKGIKMTDKRLQANTHFAVTVAAGAMRHIIDNFSRDYLVERIEHQLENALLTSVYPHVSLGPGQRYASKGCYIAKLPERGAKRLSAVSGWLVP